MTTRSIVLMAAIAAGALVLGACASQNAGTPASKPAVAQAAPAATSQQKGQQMICSSSMPVGSHIAQTDCVTEQQYQQEQKAHAAERAKLQQMEQQQQAKQNPMGGPPR